MAKAKTYRLWTAKAKSETSIVAIQDALEVGSHWLFTSQNKCKREIEFWLNGQAEPISFFVRVVPPAKRKRRAKR